MAFASVRSIRREMCRYLGVPVQGWRRRRAVRDTARRLLALEAADLLRASERIVEQQRSRAAQQTVERRGRLRALAARVLGVVLRGRS